VSRLAILVLALALAGCEHMYGGFDRGRLVGTAQPDARDAELVAIARAEAARREIPLENIRAPVILDDGAILVVVLDPPPAGWKGGGVEVSIDRKSKQVVGLERTK